MKTYKIKLKHLLIVFFRKFSFLLYIRSLTRIREIFFARKEVGAMFDRMFVDTNTDYDKKDLLSFKRGFSKSIFFGIHKIPVVREFSEVELINVSNKFTSNDIEKNTPLIICVVKNDLERIKLFLDHHIKLGVSHFVFIDNNSDDGTCEFLIAQPNVNVYRCYSQYSTLKREGWINKVMLYYGINRWYLCLDSDELFVYQNYEVLSISKFIKNLEVKNIYSVRTLMLDMYSNQKLVSEFVVKDIKSEYAYFDEEGYKMDSSLIYDSVTGGPRNRIFSTTELPFKPNLIKTPLFKCTYGDVQISSHYLFPFSKNYNAPLIGFLLHYKFLPGDLKKYKERAISKNYFNGSAEYINYVKLIENEPDSTFLYDKSVKFVDSSSLSSINVIGINHYI